MSLLVSYSSSDEEEGEDGSADGSSPPGPCPENLKTTPPEQANAVVESEMHELRDEVRPVVSATSVEEGQEGVMSSSHLPQTGTTVEGNVGVESNEVVEQYYVRVEDGYGTVTNQSPAGYSGKVDEQGCSIDNGCEEDIVNRYSEGEGAKEGCSKDGVDEGAERGCSEGGGYEVAEREHSESGEYTESGEYEVAEQGRSEGGEYEVEWGRSEGGGYEDEKYEGTEQGCSEDGRNEGAQQECSEKESYMEYVAVEEESSEGGGREGVEEIHVESGGYEQEYAEDGGVENADWEPSVDGKVESMAVSTSQDQTVERTTPNLPTSAIQQIPIEPDIYTRRHGVASAEKADSTLLSMPKTPDDEMAQAVASEVTVIPQTSPEETGEEYVYVEYTTEGYSSDPQSQYPHGEEGVYYPNDQYYDQDTYIYQDNQQYYEQYEGGQDQQYVGGQDQHFEEQQPVEGQDQQCIVEQVEGSQDQQYTGGQDQQVEGSQDQQYVEGQDQHFEGSQDQQVEGQDQQFEGSQNVEGQDQHFEGSQDQQYVGGQDQQFEGSQDQQYVEGQHQQFEGSQDQQYVEGQDQQFEGSQDVEGQDQHFEGSQDQQYVGGQDQQFEGSHDLQYVGGPDQQFEGSQDVEGQDQQFEGSQDQHFVGGQNQEFQQFVKGQNQQFEGSQDQQLVVSHQQFEGQQFVGGQDQQYVLVQDQQNVGGQDQQSILQQYYPNSYPQGQHYYDEDQHYDPQQQQQQQQQGQQYVQGQHSVQQYPQNQQLQQQFPQVQGQPVAHPYEQQPFPQVQGQPQGPVAQPHEQQQFPQVQGQPQGPVAQPHEQQQFPQVQGQPQGQVAHPHEQQQFPQVQGQPQGPVAQPHEQQQFPQVQGQPQGPVAHPHEQQQFPQVQGQPQGQVAHPHEQQQQQQQEQYPQQYMISQQYPQEQKKQLQQYSTHQEQQQYPREQQKPPQDQQLYPRNQPAYSQSEQGYYRGDYRRFSHHQIPQELNKKSHELESGQTYTSGASPLISRPEQRSGRGYGDQQPAYRYRSPYHRDGVTRGRWQGDHRGIEERDQRGGRYQNRYSPHSPASTFRDSPPARQDSNSPLQSFDGRSGVSVPKDPRTRRIENSPSGDSRSRRDHSRRSPPSEPARHYTKSAKYAAVSTNFVQRTNSLLKQSSKLGDKDAKGVQLVQPHSAPESTVKKKKGEKSKSGSFKSEVGTGLKKSLLGFKIPKRKSARESPTVSSPVKPAVKIPALDFSETKKDGQGKDARSKLRLTESENFTEEKKPDQTAAASIESSRVVQESEKDASSILLSSTVSSHGQQQVLPHVASPAQDSLSKIVSKPVALKSQESPAKIASLLSKAPKSISIDLNRVPQSFATSSSAAAVGSLAAASVPISTTGTPTLNLKTTAASGGIKLTSAKDTKASISKSKKAKVLPPSSGKVLPAAARASKPKDLTLLLQSLGPGVLQTLAASIQQTLEAVEKKVTSKSTTVGAVTTTSSSSSEVTASVSSSGQSLSSVSAMELGPPAKAQPQMLVAKKPSLQHGVVSTTLSAGGTLHKAQGSTLKGTCQGQSTGLVLATVLPSTDTNLPVMLGSNTALSQSTKETENNSSDRNLQSLRGPERNDASISMKLEESGDVSGVKLRCDEEVVGESPKTHTDVPVNATAEGSTKENSDATTIVVPTATGSADNSNKLSFTVVGLNPSLPLPEDDNPSVFVDANFRVMYKEYNLRRSKTFITAVKPEKQKPNCTPAVSVEEARKSSPEKRQRSAEDSAEDQAAKRLKVDEDVTDVEMKVFHEPKVLSQVEAKKSTIPVKISPTKGIRGRKPSFSQSKKSHKRRRIPATREAMDMAICVLCSRRDSSGNLGFLYGPYKPLPPEKPQSPDASATVAEEERVVDCSLWVHEDCAVWAPGVCLVKGKLLGLFEAVADGKALACHLCKSAGATLCCSARGCKAVYHYPCARESGCSLKEEQFLIACPKHKLPS